MNVTKTLINLSWSIYRFVDNLPKKVFECIKDLYNINNNSDNCKIIKGYSIWYEVEDNGRINF